MLRLSGWLSIGRARLRFPIGQQLRRGRGRMRPARFSFKCLSSSNLQPVRCYISSKRDRKLKEVHMRTSREVKAQHHDKIVSTASKMLRGCGVDRTSVIDLMRGAGLTHGGFYRHFKSKDELVAQSTRNIFRAIILRFQVRSAKEGPKAALSAYVEDYLTGRHLKFPEEGCPVAAYGAEAARECRAVREAFAEGIDQMLS